MGEGIVNVVHQTESFETELQSLFNWCSCVDTKEFICAADWGTNFLEDGASSPAVCNMLQAIRIGPFFAERALGNLIPSFSCFFTFCSAMRRSRSDCPGRSQTTAKRKKDSRKLCMLGSLVGFFIASLHAELLKHMNCSRCLSNPI